MSRLENISFENEPSDVKEKVKSYWTKRSDSFSKHKHAEMHSEKNKLWREEFKNKLGEKPLKILDVGCGAGFFEAVLAPMGYDITGIDLTPEMVEKGKDILKRHNIKAELFVGDGEEPDFPEESFDAVISRNLVWTLPHPDKAYKNWYKLLKKGGPLLVYDAEYAKGFHSLDQSKNRAHADVTDELKEECHDIYHMLSISSLDRPEWDIDVLKGIGFSSAEADLTVGDRIYNTEDEFYISEQ